METRNSASLTDYKDTWGAQTSLGRVLHQFLFSKGRGGREAPPSRGKKESLFVSKSEYRFDLIE